MSKILHRSVAVLTLLVCLTLIPASVIHAAPSFLTPDEAPPVSQEVVESDPAPGWLEVALDRLAALFGFSPDLVGNTGDGSCPDDGTDHGGGMDTDG